MKKLPVTLHDGNSISCGGTQSKWYISKELACESYRYWHADTRTFEHSGPTYFDTLQEAYDAYYITPEDRLAKYKFSDRDISKVKVNYNGHVLFTIGDVEFMLKSSDVDRLTQYYEEVRK